MSSWKELIPILLILLLLTACSSDQTKAAGTEQANKHPETTSQASVENNLETISQAAADVDPESASQAAAKLDSTLQDAAEGDVGDNTPLEWPSELMDNIPSPSGGTITSIDRGDSFYGEGGPEYITVVSVRGMDLSDCQTYAANLMELGFLYDVTEQQTDSEYIYSGSLETGEAGVTFKYDFEYDIGFVSYNPKLNAESSETVTN